MAMVGLNLASKRGLSKGRKNAIKCTLSSDPSTSQGASSNSIIFKIGTILIVLFGLSIPSALAIRK